MRLVELVLAGVVAGEGREVDDEDPRVAFDGELQDRGQVFPLVLRVVLVVEALVFLAERRVEGGLVATHEAAHGVAAPHQLDVGNQLL